MTHHHAVRLALPVVAALMFTACSDTTAPSARALNVAAVSAVSGGPNIADYKSFAGELWVCPDTPTPGTGFFYAWKIVDNATNAVVANGTLKNVVTGTCIHLGSVPTGTPGRFTATVKEDPGNAWQVSAITAAYGSNLPRTAPTATVTISKRTISSLITHDFGVQFTFSH